MSKNHPHDNIYSILGKLEALTPKEAPKSEAPTLKEYAEIPAKGSILTGVKTTEQVLAEKYMGFKKLEKSIAAKGDVKDAGAVAAAIGREKYGKKAFQKAAAAGKKMGETLDGGMGGMGVVGEKAVSQAQQKFMGMAHAMQKGEKIKGASPELKKVAKTMKPKDTHDFAATKHKGLPQHVSEKYDPVKAVKQCARDYMEMNGIRSVHDLEAEDIESIGGDCQMNYQDVCEILGCNLPDSLGPVNSFGPDEHGNIVDFEESSCNECGMFESECSCDHTNEGEVSKTKHGIKHTKTDFPGYPSDDIEKDDEEDNKPKKGRPRKAVTKNPRRDPKNKGNVGRPKKEKSDSDRHQGGLSKSHDPFGRVKHDSKKTDSDSGKKYSMGKMVAESVNFKRMMEEQHMTLEEMLECMSTDMQQFKETGVCSDRLRDMMEVYAHSKRQMEENVLPFPGQQATAQQPSKSPWEHVKGGNPANPHPVGSSLPASQIPGKTALLKGRGRNYYEEDAMEAELNELAKLAGLSMADEGNAFTGKLKDTPKGEKFDLDGKEYTDTSTLDEEPNEGNEFSGELAKARAQHKDSFEVDGKEYQVKEAKEDHCSKCDCDPCECDDEKDTKKDSVKEAQELLAMLRVAGLDTGKIEEALAKDEKTYGDPEVDDNTSDQDPVNGTKEEYMSMKASTLNPGEADSGEKNNYDGAGDNKMKQQPNRPAKPVKTMETTLKLEAKLAAEYESIKKSN